MNEIRWGIIGCGDVTENKSGPAFQKVPQSSLLAVMRRNEALAADYARRHQVPRYYGNAQALIDDADINAVYIATAPDSHESYCLAAMQAGKAVYVEKPMALNYAAALRIQQFAMAHDAKISVAHYRNAQPFFEAIKNKLENGAIGTVKEVQVLLQRPLLSTKELEHSGKKWRVDPAVSGGGLFHDLAPHQLGLMLHYFGAANWVQGRAYCTQHRYAAADRVEGEIQFANGVKLMGNWNFNADESKDQCLIIGSRGSIRFSFFGPQNFCLLSGATNQEFSFQPPQHVQQPLIEKVVQYFLGHAANPVSVNDGCRVMQWMEAMSAT